MESSASLDASENLRQGKELVLNAVDLSAANDHEFAISAIEGNADVIQYASDEIKDDMSIAYAAASISTSLRESGAVKRRYGTLWSLRLVFTIMRESKVVIYSSLPAD